MDVHRVAQADLKVVKGLEEGRADLNVPVVERESCRVILSRDFEVRPKSRPREEILQGPAGSVLAGYQCALRPFCLGSAGVVGPHI
jgi:hypothetical protein